ncbi:3-deoxy-D-manno-octulosonic acid transferase [Gammaproteobacteria bacterium]|nr:3-deoxy-D-manno-octulosonic acid transferase [Gammaproteobacteria bacterium]
MMKSRNVVSDSTPRLGLGWRLQWAAYQILWLLLLPLVVARMLWRGRSEPAYRERLAERLGRLAADSCDCQPVSAGAPIWVHAVSVGESRAASPLIEALLQQGHRVLVTTTTPTGARQVSQDFADRVCHRYLPWDFSPLIRHFIEREAPRALIIMETEIWPSLLYESNRSGVAIAFANMRLSAKSSRGYTRLRRFLAPLLRPVRAFCVQSDDDAAGLRQFVSKDASISVCGNLKYNIAIDSQLSEIAKKKWNEIQHFDRPTWIAASTHAGEEEIVCKAHRTVLARHPQALLIIVPRHPHRFDEVATQIADSGLSLQRRSQGGALKASSAVYLADSMGELLMLYAIADVALVCGSLVPAIGGHNLLEPMALGIPTLHGPFMHNNRHLQAQVKALGATIEVNADSLAGEIARCIDDPQALNAQRAASATLVKAGRESLPLHQAALGSLVDE